MKEISVVDFERWKQDPVTIEFLSVVEGHRKTALDDLVYTGSDDLRMFGECQGKVRLAEVLLNMTAEELQILGEEEWH